MKINLNSYFGIANAAIALSLFVIGSSKAISATKNEMHQQSANAKRFSPSMYSYTGQCEIVNINGFKDQEFLCKLQLESGRGWWIFIQPSGSENDAYHEGAYLSFNGYSEECGFGIGCPFRLEEGTLSNALQKVSSPNRTPSDFYISKWDKFELKLVFDYGTNKSAFTFRSK